MQIERGWRLERAFLSVEIDVAKQELRGAVEYVITPVRSELGEIRLDAAEGCELVRCYVDTHLASADLKHLSDETRALEQVVTKGKVRTAHATPAAAPAARRGGLPP